MGSGGCPTAPEAPTCWMLAHSAVDCSNLKSQLDTIAVENFTRKLQQPNPILVVVVVVEEAGTEGGLHHPDHTSHCHLSVIEYHRKDMDNGPEVRRFFKTCPTTSPLEIFGWCKVPLQTPSSTAFY